MEDILEQMLRAFQTGSDASFEIDGVEQQVSADQLENVLGEFATTSSGQKALSQVATNKKLGELSDLAGQITTMAGQVSDISNSKKQIEAAKEGLRSLKKPQAPGVSPTDPALDREIYGAQQGTLDQSRLAGAARAGFDETYNRDIAQARQASTGQAGAYGAMGQLASGRRNRAEIGLAPQMDTIRRGEQARTGQLLRDREGQAARRFRNREGLYNTGLGQYNLESRAAGGLMSTGMTNRRNAWRGLGQNAANLPRSLSGMVNFGNQEAGAPQSPKMEDFNLMDYEDMINKNIGLNQYTA